MGKKNTTLITAFLLVIFIIGNSFSFAPFCKKQGIKGSVFLVKGNQMPSPDIPLPAPKPAKTTIYIYEITNISQVARTGASPFYSSINTKLVKEIRSNSKGGFKVRLDPGRYSVFTKKGDLFYANLFDQDNNIAPVTVAPGSFTDLTIKVDYDAVY